ncbi:CE1759 family FMN reductase [Brevibacterium litoralis]|uniref:CE1759 family FMN reductase n=1 Tax=Brevibacterium litoralis TaxID=3138935 RepID=UPI0032EDF235
MYRIVALSGGTGEPSNSTKLAERLLTAARAQFPGHEVETEVIALRPLAHDLVDMSLTGIASDRLQAAFDSIRTAHGVVVVTSVYNASPFGLFSLFLQLFPDGGLDGLPVTLAATGGTARHSLVVESHVRPLVSYLHGLALPTTVFAATDDWGAPEASTGLGARVQRAAGELARAIIGRPVEQHDVFDELDPDGITPFDQLLGGR